MFKGKVFPVIMALLLVPALLLACAPAAQSGTVSAGPIVVGYVGQTSSPGVKPCLDLVKIAVDEINAKGGVSGRPLKFVVEDSKGETSLSAAAMQRLVMSNRPIMVQIEGRSEIALAVKETSANIFKDYPHICLINGAADWEVTDKIVSQYDRYKGFFRDYEFAQYPFFYNFPLTMFDQVMKAKKIAVLYEDFYWTRIYQEGGGPTGLPSFKDYAASRGFEVVYNKPIKSRSGMWLPTLESIAQAKADVIFVWSSWFTDTEVLGKQWADSSAKDIQLMVMGGPSNGYSFWNLTGGKCLGMMSSFWEVPCPITPEFPPLVKKCRDNNIPLNTHVLLAYNNIYFLKQVLEKVGKTDDIDAVIKGYETHRYDSPIGPIQFHSEKQEPWFHSGNIADKKNPLEFSSPLFLTEYAQFQGPDKVELIWGSPAADKCKKPENYKTPAQLRAAAGIK